MDINVEVKKCVLHPLEYPGCVFATCIYSMSQIDTNILWRQMEHQFISGHPAFLFTLLELLLLLAALRSPIAAVSWANIWQSCFLLKPKQVAHHHHYIKSHYRWFPISNCQRCLVAVQPNCLAPPPGATGPQCLQRYEADLTLSSSVGTNSSLGTHSTFYWELRQLLNSAFGIIPALLQLLYLKSKRLQVSDVLQTKTSAQISVCEYQTPRSRNTVGVKRHTVYLHFALLCIISGWNGRRSGFER